MQRFDGIKYKIARYNPEKSNVNMSNDYEELISMIYSAPINPENWSHVLDKISELTNSRGSALLVERKDGWIGWRASDSLQPQINFYLEKHNNTKFGLINNRIKARNSPEFFANHQIFDEAEWQNTVFMNNYGKPNGLEHLVATYIELPHGDKIVIASTREASKGKYEDHVIEELNAIRAHLARAAMLTTNLGMKRITSAVETVGNLSLPVMLIDSTGHINVSNDTLDIFKNYFSISNEKRIEFSSRMKAIIASITSGDSALLSRAKSVPLRTVNDEPAILHLMPLPSFYSDFFKEDTPESRIFDVSNIMLILTPIIRETETNAQIIASLFDLTVTEAKVASKISLGMSIDDVADAMHVSKETIKTHMKSIFSKTGVNRQTQLVSLVSGITKFGDAIDSI